MRKHPIKAGFRTLTRKLWNNKGRGPRPTMLLVFILVFGGIGMYYLAASHAATTNSGTGAGSGTITSPASIVNDLSASNDQAVQFGTNATGVHIITSLYAYPTLPVWSQVEQGTPGIKYAIANICAPDGSGSGCGSPADEKNPDWPATLQALENNGITPLYYISTNYGALSLAVLESELDNAVAWYGIASPMFDATANGGTCSNGGDPMPCASYYGNLYSYAISKGAAAVVYNPGVVPPGSYMFGPKVIMQVYEGTASGFQSTSFPSWMAGYPADEFAATLYAGTASTIGKDITAAAHDGIGNFYENDEAEPPGYSTLPSYWQTEITDVQATE